MASVIDKSGNIDYFGRLSWGNFFDWLITLCLGGTIALFAVSLGGVRADTHLVLLPLFLIVLALHGIWLAVDNESPKRLSHVPLYFLPFFIWAVINANWLSPTAWLGHHELIYGLEAFIFFWVLVNNVRTRAHLWVMIVMSLSPAAYAIFIGFYQFFQNPRKMADALAEHGIQLSPEFLGHATGSFADPNTFAVFLLVLLPFLLIAGAVPRLPTVLRVLCFYVAAMFLVSLAFTQLFWPLFVLVPLILLVPFLCFQKRAQRFLFPLLGIGGVLLVVAGMTLFHPKFKRDFESAISPEGEAVRFELWKGASDLFLDAPLTGVGAGAFSLAFEQNEAVFLPELAQTPHNDYLLLLAEYGLIGGLLLGGPVFWIFFGAVRRWKMEPARAKLKDRKGSIMPPQKFFLSISLASFLVFLICAGWSFVFYVPVLFLYGVFSFAMLVKSSTNRRLQIPEAAVLRYVYALSGVVLAFSFFNYATPRLKAQAIELQARQRLDHLVEQRVHVSGNAALLEQVIVLYEEAVLLDPSNVDAWIGLSAAQCQRFFQNPADFEAIGAGAVAAVQHAIDLSEYNSMAWGQLGVAYSLSGDLDAAKKALQRALALAPNSSNAHYQWAAYLSHLPENREAALRSVKHAIEINPQNAAARRLEQKLLIL